MLILSRRIGEKIIITTETRQQITLCLVDQRNGNSRIGIDAPKSITVHREEIHQRLQEQRKAA